MVSERQGDRGQMIHVLDTEMEMEMEMEMEIVKEIEIVKEMEI